MTPFGWAALGAAVLMFPGVTPAQGRAALLAERGRLSPLPTGRYRLPALSPAPGVLAALGCVVASAAVGLRFGMVLAATTAVGAATLARLLAVTLRARATRLDQAELLAALRLLSAELDAGARPDAAFEAAAEVCSQHRVELVAAAQSCRSGEQPALLAAPLAGLTQAWRVADASGAPLAAIIGRVADDLLGQIDQRRSVAAAVAGARSSAALLAGLPVLGLLLGAAMQAHPLLVLTGSPSGRLLFLVGVTLDAAGLLWTQQLAGRAERTL